MFSTAPFEEANDGLKKMIELIPCCYNEQLQNGIEFIMTLDELQKITNLLIDSPTARESTAKFKKELKALEIILPRALPETLFRTIILGSYSYGHWETFQRTKKFLPYLRYSAINDSRIRNNHLEMSSVIREIDDRFWQTHYPPNGINCRCTCTALTESQAIAKSESSKGINQFITDKMKPDDGWNFNISEDLAAFVKVGIVGLVRKDAIYSDC